MSKFDEQYLDLCERVLKYGEKVTTDPAVLEEKMDEKTKLSMPNHYAQTVKPTTTIRLPHQVLRFDLAEEFPILTTKQVGFKTAVLEMLWIYQAQSNEISWLHERGVKIWDEWEIDEKGDYMGRHFGKEFAGTIGTAYGWIVRKYQLTQTLIETLKKDVHNRRMVVSLWQNEWLPTAALPSCVWNSQWNVTNGRVNTLVTSRSSDIPLGLPFNITQYAVFNYLIAHCLGLEPGELTFVTNDAHIYENQIEGIREQLRRRDERMREEGGLLPAPRLWINPEVRDFFEFDNSRELKDIRLEGYEHMGLIIMTVTE
ncbi:thymidylate synthase [Candidatus Saccharibacteria bacterium]|nr:thymidylate synthase [Candidatus Saccharibacteria bacterium]